MSAEIDDKQLKALMRYRPTADEAGEFFEVSGRTVERYIRDQYDLTYIEFRDRHMFELKRALMKKAYEKALQGDNTMLKTCLENICGWGMPEADQPIKTVAAKRENQDPEQQANLLRIARGVKK